ncbi:MAG TPA: hypothetical protein VFR21_23685, partial [Bradyrhizobium sp.]|nr:hypothetical protein [Bradyrhizobium sp.]
MASEHSGRQARPTLQREDLQQRLPPAACQELEAAFPVAGGDMLQLKDKVGRFATTGRNCQNWKTDQELVISLLNKIAISDGGA